MTDSVEHISFCVFLIGVIVVASMAVRTIFRRLGAPPLIGFILLGFALRLIDTRWDLLSGATGEGLQLLAAIGIFALLFRVGLESNVKGLLGELPRALAIWLGNVGLSGLLGYGAARYLLDLPLIPSLFVAVALTATSIGVSVQVWHDAGRLKTRRGNLLIDVAELDDVSAVVLMLMLFALAPVLALPDDGTLLSVAGGAAALIALKAALFGVACFLFARYLERPITDVLSRVEPLPDPLLPVVGIGLIIAAIAGMLGFSLALGALFAGIMFSRDPKAVRVDASFDAIYQLLVPFFFIGIGLQIAPDSLGLAAGLGAVLLAAAVVGKLVGAGVPAWPLDGWTGAVLLSVSMVPRAEIALVVIMEGRRLGPWAISDEVFAAVTLVVLASSLCAPLALRYLFARIPPGSDGVEPSTDDKTDPTRR
jgi:Kef-type K+ transport system membrane component KefB